DRLGEVAGISTDGVAHALVEDGLHRPGERVALLAALGHRLRQRVGDQLAHPVIEPVLDAPDPVLLGAYEQRAEIVERLLGGTGSPRSFHEPSMSGTGRSRLTPLPGARGCRTGPPPRRRARPAPSTLLPPRPRARARTWTRALPACAAPRP